MFKVQGKLVTFFNGILLQLLTNRLPFPERIWPITMSWSQNHSKAAKAVPTCSIRWWTSAAAKPKNVFYSLDYTQWPIFTVIVVKPFWVGNTSKLTSLAKNTRRASSLLNWPTWSRRTAGKTRAENRSFARESKQKKTNFERGVKNAFLFIKIIFSLLKKLVYINPTIL